MQDVMSDLGEIAVGKAANKIFDDIIPGIENKLEEGVSKQSTSFIKP